MKKIKRCFLSVYALKSLITIGIIVTLIMGVVFLYVLVYAYAVSTPAAQIQSKIRLFFVISFLISSVLMMLSSLCGIYGIYFTNFEGLVRKKYKFVIFYTSTMFLYFIAFMVLGVFITQYPSLLVQQCENGQSNSYIQAINMANETLCKTCRCGFHNIQYYSQEEKQILYEMNFTNYPDEPQNQTYPTNAENCQTWSNLTYQETEQIIMIEAFFNCSGWCDTDYNLYYLFTDVNNGKPENTCVIAMLNFFDKFGMIMEIACFVISGILLIILIGIICLSFHPDRSKGYDTIKFYEDTFRMEQALTRKKSLNTSHSAEYT